MPRFYRSMTREGDRPKVGPTGRTLGVRVPADIPATDGLVRPETGGMSVVPAWRDLKTHRIPRRLRHLAPDARGPNEDACWVMGQGPFGPGPVADGLTLRPTSPDHGLVEPSESMLLDHYQTSLAATRDAWCIDEE